MSVKFSDFSATPITSTGYIVGYDTSSNQNIRFTLSQLSSAILGNWTESTSVFSSIRSNRFQALGADANINAVISPKGSGSLLAQSPDGTTAGGDARGQFSVDLQVNRGAANQVASGNFATLSGGTSNNVQGSYSTVAGGFNNYIGSQYSFAAGRQNFITGQYAVALGYQANGYLYGQNSFASGAFNTAGDAQLSSAVSRGTVASNATGATFILYLDGQNQTSLITIGSNRALNVTIETVAVITSITGTATGVTVGDIYRETKQFAFKNVGGVSSIVGTVDTTSVKSNTSMSACALTPSVGTTQELKLTFTGPTFTGGGSVGMRVVSTSTFTEVAW